MTLMDQISVDGAYFLDPNRCSGALYSLQIMKTQVNACLLLHVHFLSHLVPISSTMCLSLRADDVSEYECAQPKSQIYIQPDVSSTRILLGLMSQCIISCWCKYSNPFEI